MQIGSFVEIVLIAVGLAMDAFAVSITSGTIIKKMRLHHAVRIALFFGVSQGVMPVIGWFGGSLFASKIEAVDHWIAFGLLAAIGGKMIKDSFDSEEKSFNPIDVYVLFTLAVATSIDALAVGITFSMLGVTIVSASLTIGVVTFLTSLAGVFIGNRVGDRLGGRVEVFGGVVLVGIGVKILVGHLFLM